jgi:hypothetical protein
VIVLLKDVQKSNDRAVSAIEGAMQTRGQTLIMAASTTGRA